MASIRLLVTSAAPMILRAVNGGLEARIPIDAMQAQWPQPRGITTLLQVPPRPEGRTVPAVARPLYGLPVPPIVTPPGAMQRGQPREATEAHEVGGRTHARGVGTEAALIEKALGIRI